METATFCVYTPSHWYELFSNWIMKTVTETRDAHVYLFYLEYQQPLIYKSEWFQSAHWSRKRKGFIVAKVLGLNAILRLDWGGKIQLTLRPKCLVKSRARLFINLILIMHSLLMLKTELNFLFPNLVKTASRTPSSTSSAGTYEPAWARITIRATCKGKKSRNNPADR